MLSGCSIAGSAAFQVIWHQHPLPSAINTGRAGLRILQDFRTSSTAHIDVHRSLCDYSYPAMASSVAPAPTRQQSVYGASASVDSLAVDSTVKLPYSPASSDEEFELQPPVAPFMGKNVKTMSGSLRPSPRTHNRARSSLSSVTSFQDSIFSTTSAETTLTLPDPAEVDLPVLARTGIIVVSFGAYLSFIFGLCLIAILLL